MYLITKTVHGCTCWLNNGSWQGLKDNAGWYNMKAALEIIAELKSTTPDIKLVRV